MKRDYKLYLNDIKESILQIEKYLLGISEEDFKKNKEKQDAIIRRLEIIGEAGRSIPKALKDKNKHVPWFGMSQFRDFIAHSYFNLSLTTLWKTAKDKIPQIKEAINKITLV